MAFSFNKIKRSYAKHMAKSDILLGKEWEKYARNKPWSPNPDDYEWDLETGMPIGLTRMPEGDAAIRFQQRHKELVAKRNASLRRQAMIYLEQGQRVSESFRRGGYANDNYFGAMSQQAMNSQIQEQDLMGGYREFAAKEAQQSQDFAASRANVANIASLVASLYTGGAGAAITRMGNSDKGGFNLNRNTYNNSVDAGNPYVEPNFA